jgi:hypothetical protein
MGNVKGSRKNLASEKKKNSIVLPSCPKCGSNKHIVKCDEQHAVFQLFIATPLNTWFCLKCESGW